MHAEKGHVSKETTLINVNLVLWTGFWKCLLSPNIENVFFVVLFY